MAKSTTTTSSKFKKPGDPGIGSCGLAGWSVDLDSQLHPGTVAITASLSNGDKDGITLVGRVETRDLRKRDPTADPRWEEVWNVQRWDVFQPGKVALSLVFAEKGLLNGDPLPEPDASWHTATLLYNYIALDDVQVRTMDVGLSGSAQYFEVLDGGNVTGWLYRSLRTGNPFADLWVLKANYSAPDTFHSVTLTPRTNPYASATAFLNAVNTQRKGETGWLAVKVFYAFS